MPENAFSLSYDVLSVSEIKLSVKKLWGFKKGRIYRWKCL